MANSQKSKRPDRLRRVVMLVAPPIEELDLVGPWEVFATSNNAINQRKSGYDLHLLTTSRQRTFTGDSRLTIHADGYYKDFSGSLDTLIIPGGTGPQQSCDRQVLNWICTQSRRARRVVSICTGAFLLARAGILHGVHATTHWKYTEALTKQYPDISIDSDRIYVRDGSIYTSAGVTAGMDLALALVEEDFGSTIALKVAQALVLFLRRPGGQAQFSSLLRSQATDSQPIRELLVWMEENLRRDLSVEALASRVAMSPRNFSRVFTREVGTSPARFVEQMRLEAARGTIETSVKGLKQIAVSVGFSSQELLRRAFHRSLGISPVAYRERFRRESQARSTK